MCEFKCVIDSEIPLSNYKTTSPKLEHVTKKIWASKIIHCSNSFYAKHEFSAFFTEGTELIPNHNHKINLLHEKLKDLHCPQVPTLLIFFTVNLATTFSFGLKFWNTIILGVNDRTGIPALLVPVLTILSICMLFNFCKRSTVLSRISLRYSDGMIWR